MAEPRAFFAIASQIMRRVLVNYARDRAATKRGGGMHQLAINDMAVLSDERAAGLLLVNDALESLAKLDDRKCRIVEMRYFGGLGTEEIAERCSAFIQIQ